jgi:ribose transport system substrate-binding protein
MFMVRWSLSTVACVLFGLVGCGGSPHAADEKYYLVSMNIKVPYWQDAQAGLSRAASELQVRAELVGPDTYDPKAQHEHFLDVLKRKPTGILASASDPNLIKDDIDRAIGQGIPVIAIDADAPTSKRLTFIGTDNYKAGVMGGRVAAAKLQGKGHVVVYTMPDPVNLRERLHGYRDVFAEHPGIKVDVVDTKGDPRVAFDTTMDLMEKGKVDAFVCLISTAGPEVAEVLGRKNATDKVVVAMDTDQHTLEGIRKGLITATIGQKPFTMAYLGLKALDHLHHHPLSSLTGNWVQDSFSPLPTFVDTGATLIDKSNVDNFIQQRASAGARK